MSRRPRSTLAAGLSLLPLLSLLGVTACGLVGRTGPRVLLVGVDGADPDVLDRLIGSGKLPTFARLKREGAYGRLRSREPLLSPIVWTSIATGRKGQDHGVLDFVEAAEDGKPVPITSSRRRVPALWNILRDGHRRVPQPRRRAEVVPHLEGPALRDGVRSRAQPQHGADRGLHPRPRDVRAHQEEVRTSLVWGVLRRTPQTPPPLRGSLSPLSPANANRGG